jgi:SAM-dependent methyltransferase
VPLLDDDLVLSNVPRGAQSLPSEDELAGDGGIDLRVCACRACGLVQLKNEPVPYYRQVITAAGWSPKMREFRREQMRQLVERFALQGKRVVEVGSGEGYLLDLLAEASAIAVGLETGTVARERGRAAGRRVLDAYPRPGVAIEGAPFDAFVTINFLEHSPDPRAFLTGIRENLVPDAIGLVEVPSFEKVLATQRFYDFVADHLSYFTRETLCRTLELAGFDVLDCGLVWEDDDIVAAVRVRPAPDLRAVMRVAAEQIRELSAFFAVTGRKVAVWGASHQALTLLALAGAAGVAYVVDSAPFKQGRYTPVTHLPIVAPARLEAEPVDAVLVMAAGYSDEVVRTLREMPSYRGAIAVLREGSLDLVRSGSRA